MTTFQNNQDDDLEYTLTVSQFAKLCGTTRDTLRYYYEQNIIKPRVDPDNGYHYYSASQISSFFFISTMRQTGCSIKEIRNIIYNSSKESITDLVNSKITAMQRELFSINKKISALHLGMWILDKYEDHGPDKPYMDIFPDISVTTTKIENKIDAYHAADIARDISVHMTRVKDDDTLSTFPSGVTMNYNDLIKKNYVYNSIISLSFLPADNTDSFPLPSSKAVCCYHDHHSPIIERTYQKMVSYIKKNRLKACSDLYSISLINLYNKEETHSYFKYLFICVE
ncbi:MerR family transcriptional regulator [Butyrivibrio sp. X503]|uniref:MerR family transcriptional regulator n=1 Tax=Butyrivibrio sp. X503 TaxID=2364878 RepID=UPI000EA8BAB5|nr:MerR family transcriptional regulator [Butyrivibrio sp. X503]RKM53986.1 MerR family transcriptional regulator [Butyrivibrio sp. X503]